jgi:hypothetical protein
MNALNVERGVAFMVFELNGPKIAVPFNKFNSL